MTGVVTSNRCGTCRARKVKCDEVKPICGPCNKSNRQCEAPASRWKFQKPAVSETCKVSASAAVTSLPVRNSNLIPSRDFSVVNCTATKDGAVFQKMRVARLKRVVRRSPEDGNHDRARSGLNDVDDQVLIARHPASSTVQSLQAALIHRLEEKSIGLNIALLSNCIGAVPARIGHSAALDSAVACVIAGHAALARGEKDKDSRIRPKLYDKAIREVRMALQDPVEGFSSNTLAAVVLLGYFEVIGGAPRGKNYVKHAGGAARLIQLRGPARHQDDFSRLVLIDMRGAAVMNAIFNGEDCFLHSAEWKRTFEPPKFAQPARRHVHEIFYQFSRLPSILRKVRRLQDGGNEYDPTDLLREVQEVRRALQDPGEAIALAIEKGDEISERVSATYDTLVPVVYHFNHLILAVRSNMFWGMSIVINQIIARLVPTPSVALFGQCIDYAERILMSYEYASAYKPLGSLFMNFPFMIAFRCVDENKREWIIKGLEECTPNAEGCWTASRLEWVSRWWFGDPVLFEDLEQTDGVPWDDDF